MALIPRIMRRPCRQAVPASFGGGAGTLFGFKQRIKASRGLGDYAHAAVMLAIPPHTAMEIRSRSAWVGIPRALWLRFSTLARTLLGLRDRRMPIRPDAPCAEQPEHVA